jgi:hypothetical protein
MQRSLVASALGLALLGSTVFGAAAASADPNLSVTADSTSIDPGHQLDGGQEIVYKVTGCTTEGGAPGYVGVYLSNSGDPSTDAGADHAEAPADETGGVTWVAGVVNASEGVPATVYIRWYCSSVPAAGWTDPSILYAGPLMTFTMGGNAVAGRSAQTSAPQLQLRVAKTSAKSVSRSGSRPVSKSGSKSGSKSAAPTVTTTTTAHGTVDPDALPAVDKLNIVGSRAASLKARTDLVEWFTAPRRLGRNTAPRTTAEDVHYVRSAFIALSGRTPSAKVAAGYAAQLSSGQTRVKVVEDIALSINPNPRFWNR